MTDEQFFETWPDRRARIRDPEPGEYKAEFLTMGDHKKDRRRILVWKVPRDNPFAPGAISRVPFLLFGDETVEDRDDVLLPLLRSIMSAAADGYGIDKPVRF